MPNESHVAAELTRLYDAGRLTSETVASALEAEQPQEGYAAALWLHSNPEFFQLLLRPAEFLRQHLHRRYIPELCFVYDVFSALPEGQWPTLAEEAAPQLTHLGHTDFTMLRALQTPALTALITRMVQKLRGVKPDKTDQSLGGDRVVGLILELCHRMTADEDPIGLLNEHKQFIRTWTLKLWALRPCWGHLETILAGNHDHPLMLLFRPILTMGLVQNGYFVGYVQATRRSDRRVMVDAGDFVLVSISGGETHHPLGSFMAVSRLGGKQLRAAGPDGRTMFESEFTEIWRPGS